jgi:porin
MKETTVKLAKKCMIGLLATTAFATPAMAHEEPFKDKLVGKMDAPREPLAPYDSKLFGNMGGLRDTLYKNGVNMVLDYKGSLWHVADGGLNEGTSYLDNLDVRFEIDGEELAGSKGTRAVVHFINNNGNPVNARRIGGYQGSDNTEVLANAFLLYEAYVEQNWGERDQYSVLVGLKELNEEFNITGISNNFIAPTFQLGQELAQSGEFGPSTFPYTALSARVQYKPTDNTYVRAAIFEGTPGDPDHLRSTRINFDDNEGVLTIAEAGITPVFASSPDAEYNLLAVGVWQYSRGFDNLVEVDGFGNPLQAKNRGAYVLGSLELMREKEQVITGFARVGVSDGNTKQVDAAYETGLVGFGLVPMRPDGEIGAGVSVAYNGNKFIQNARIAGNNPTNTESVFELYYKDVLMPGVSIQPDVQYVANPGGSSDIHDALVFGTRLGLSF